MTRPAPTCRMLACSSPARGAVTRVITAHATAMLNAVVMSAPTMGVPPKCGPSGLAFMRRDWYLYTEYANAPARGKDWSEENSAHSPSAAYTAPSLMSVVGVTMGSMRSKIFFVQLGLGPSPITSVAAPCVVAGSRASGGPSTYPSESSQMLAQLTLGLAHATGRSRVGNSVLLEPPQMMHLARCLEACMDFLL
eukprot:CAMPEP_0202866366 /NCGR_PEP_ID=MMETSP1391-20130828/7344_1 /ASSEMBLY_ACC=CAM_ASM_000867 /TAXON_ID=1034604 /ORGANISM="Chlamydomonas leiostraca, Strain SAG 11-49" /LENGTH=193 /DNA_ID=CAMNT_0049546303 /DNA_START=253 /DNA_END=835 /DNA_ORIENTATION=+